jgi:CheY-like chemotaxis protein
MFLGVTTLRGERALAAPLDTILLVDDEHPVRTVVGVMLRRAGYEVIEAESGAEAIMRFHAHTPQIRILVSDIGMPVMQGPELAQRLIALQPDLSVLLMSGYVKCSPSMFRLDDRNVAFLPKPFAASHLVAKVQELVRRSPGSAFSASGVAESDVARRTVLVVDDDRATVDLYARMLVPEGCTVITVTTGAEALRTVAQRPADVMLLDLHMPDMNGLECLRQLRRSSMPWMAVAMVTGDYFLDEAILAQVQALGAELHFKPLWVDDIVGIVRSLLSGTTHRATQ